MKLEFVFQLSAIHRFIKVVLSLSHLLGSSEIKFGQDLKKGKDLYLSNIERDGWGLDTLHASYILRIIPKVA